MIASNMRSTIIPLWSIQAFEEAPSPNIKSIQENIESIRVDGIAKAKYSGFGKSRMITFVEEQHTLQINQSE